MLRILPAILALLLVAAHFLRAGSLPLVALYVAACALPFIRRRWCLRLLQGLLLAGGGIWLYTAAVLLQQRLALGQPWLRMVLILGGVAVFTLGAAVLARGKGTEET